MSWTKKDMIRQVFETSNRDTAKCLFSESVSFNDVSCSSSSQIHVASCEIAL